MKGNSLHEKAIRLLEGDIVEVEGLSVVCVRYSGEDHECEVCEMDCLCHQGNDICGVCVECSDISRRKCYLSLVNP